MEWDHSLNHGCQRSSSRRLREVADYLEVTGCHTEWEADVETGSSISDLSIYIFTISCYEYNSSWGWGWVEMEGFRNLQKQN